MQQVRSLVISGTYRDSVFLMKLSSQAREQSGARQISAMMATPRNKDLFACSGLLTAEIENARPDDLAVAIEADPGIFALAEGVVRELLGDPAGPATLSTANPRPKSVAQAADRLPGANLALVSVAGDYAKYEAVQALEAGLDVFLYSDNIGVADELILKTLARRKGLLVMGPDCGTAIVDDIPVGFANRVRRGFVGIVGASGSGIQETGCLLDRCGLGVSSAYGTGKRDFTDAIGGLAARTALERLAADPGTQCIVVIGQAPGPKTRRALAKLYRDLGKPVFVRYLGVRDHSPEDAAGIPHAANLRELVTMTVAGVASLLDTSELDLPNPPAGRVAPGWLRGVFSGGTFCHEAAEIAAARFGRDVHSNIDVPGARRLDGALPSAGHTFLDMGADQFTIGRPHPLIHPEAKMARLSAELCDPAVAVVLTDIILGCGVGPNPAAMLVKAIDEAASRTRGKSREKAVIASVCGTEGDSPNRSSQIALLEEAGVVVLGNNVRAAERAAAMAAGDSHA